MNFTGETLAGSPALLSMLRRQELAQAWGTARGDIPSVLRVRYGQSIIGSQRPHPVIIAHQGHLQIKGPRMSDAPKMGWFVAQLRPNGLAQARVHLRRQRFESFSPERMSSQSLRGRLMQNRQPLFPGYLFVQFNPDAPGWTAINNTRGIARLLLQDPRRPRALPQSLMAGLQARCGPDELVKPADDLEVGDQIRILSGPFADFITQIDHLPDSERVGVLLDLMGRDVRTSLHRGQISKMR